MSASNIKVADHLHSECYCESKRAQLDQPADTPVQQMKCGRGFQSLNSTKEIAQALNQEV